MTSNARQKLSSGRVALVTGGAGGFGQAIAHRLAADGHAVAVADLRSADETEHLVRPAGGRFLSVKTDITSSEQVRELSRQIESELGPVDILVANADIYPIAPFSGTSWEMWRRVMDVNVDSMYHLFQTFVPSMVERKWGRVIAMVSGSFHLPIANSSAYIASKGAVIGLIRGLSCEVGTSGVTVNAVAPPLVETPGVAAGPQRKMGVFELVVNAQSIKREGRAGDPTGLISFLASDDADFVTGQTMAVDGGMLHL